MGPHQLNLILVFFFFFFFTLHFIEEFWSNPQIVKTWLSGLSRVVPSPRRPHQSGRDTEKSLFNMSKMIPTWGKIYTGFWNERGGKQHRGPFVCNESEWHLCHPCTRQEYEEMHKVYWGGRVATKLWQPNPTSSVQLCSLLLQGRSWCLSFETEGWGGCSKGNWERTASKFPLIPEHKALRTGSF